MNQLINYESIKHEKRTIKKNKKKVQSRNVVNLFFSSREDESTENGGKRILTWSMTYYFCTFSHYIFSRPFVGDIYFSN